ncbi:hypothetical protein [Neorhizobium galegae]|uniref:hypothetical protein n=1 Tax=Neorhizobium galegae TaxID=399 RepID=UPI0017852FAA
MVLAFLVAAAHDRWVVMEGNIRSPHVQVIAATERILGRFAPPQVGAGIEILGALAVFSRFSMMLRCC